MSEYFDHYHRWEPLAEFHFCIDENEELDENSEFYEDDENFVYCLCSRVFIRDGVKYYYVEKEVSESDAEIINDSHSQDCDDHSHVHFSVDTSYKARCEKDEAASCYCSASHTDNYWSTDEHDPAQIHGTMSHILQPSDSGADLTYPDCHFDKLEKMDQDFPVATDFTSEDYKSYETWDKFWAENGERLIWASWIKKYSDYINPSYLDENNVLTMNEHHIPKDISADPILGCENDTDNKCEQIDIRERKFSYDSKVNPYKKGLLNQNFSDNNVKGLQTNRDDTWLPTNRRRSCSEHDRMVSPRTLASDSMTNVTKMTLSSYDATSSHVTSNSTPTDDYSVSSTSDEQSNDQTKIVNIHASVEQVSVDELDTEDYWQLLWKKHFGELFALHYANYIECFNKIDAPDVNIDIVPQEQRVEEKLLDIEYENSEGNSQDMPTVIEVQDKVDNINLEEQIETKFEEQGEVKPKKRGKKQNNKYLSSVGVLLQNLLKDEHKKNDMDEVCEAGEQSTKKSEPISTEATNTSNMGSIEQKSISVYSFNASSKDGDDEPPDERPTTLKRSHEMDEDEDIDTTEKIKSTFEIMGFNLNAKNMPKGQIVYRKRLARLRPPRNKRFGPKKTYFDDDGNAYQPQESQDEQVLTDEDCLECKQGDQIKSNNDSLSITNRGFGLKLDEIASNITENEIENTDVTKDRNVSMSDGKDGMQVQIEDSETNEPTLNEQDEINIVKEKLQESTDVEEPAKRKKRLKHLKNDASANIDDSELPPELRDDSKMLKYWKKRHSLFHRFDEGVKLDHESWFSVTPENVARHIANKCMYNVVLDAFCGAGGNTIQFAQTAKKVIAVDIDPVKIELAKHNAAVYGVADHIEFIVGDFFTLAPELQADMVFLSPPWGGPKYSDNKQYDIEAMLEPKPASTLVKVARTISHNITLYLPRNSRTDQILSLAKEVCGSVEIEQNYLDRRFVAITAYYY